MARKRIYNLVLEDSDDENEFVRRPRWIKERENHFVNLDEKDFMMRYRLSKNSVHAVLLAIENQLEFGNDKNFSISPINQLLCALRFYATGCFQITAGDLCGFSTSSAHRIVHRVSHAIAKLLPQHVYFPGSEDEIRETRLDFFSMANFPKVVGAIDCTHIKYLKSPGGEDAEIFRNRKNYFSLNVQAICNAKLEFTDIVARWPGSTHDSHIFNNCYRKAMFDAGKYGDAVLVGDGGYSCQSYLMTPLAELHNKGEQLYNESQIRTRNVIERAFGVWKKRFPAMALGLRVTVKNSFPIIIATVVLHNIARRAREELPPQDPSVMLPAPWEAIFRLSEMAEPGTQPQQNLLRQPRHGRENPNHRQRRELIYNYFARLHAWEMGRSTRTEEEVAGVT